MRIFNAEIILGKFSGGKKRQKYFGKITAAFEFIFDLL